MKIILSPSKTQNQDSVEAKGPLIHQLDMSVRLFQELKSLTKDAIQSLMKIKNKLLDDTYELYQSFEESKKKIPAIDLYQGLVFEQLDKSKYNQEQIKYLKEHVVILSAMYGAIQPHTLIWPYRLDMTMKPKEMNLYDYWQATIDDYFDQVDVIVNLASNEFSKMLKNHSDKMIDIQFKQENQSGQLKTIAVHAKKARGHMLNQMVLHQIEDLDQLKSLNIDGYQYRESLSNHQKYVFVKAYQQ